MADDARGAWWRDAGIGAGLVAAGMIVRAFQARMLTRTAAPGMVLVRSEPNCSVRMSIESIVQLTQRTAQSNREVSSMRCRVRVSPGGLAIHCSAGLRMGADVPTVTVDIPENVLEVVERLTSLTVIDVPVRARYQGDRDEPILTR